VFKTSAKYSYLFIIISLFVSTAMFAETHAPSTENHNKEGIAEVVEEEVDIVETILHHVSDANENHLGSIGHKHISIPLPCILINKETKKLTFVMSSAFHKTHEIDGYKLEHGRVVDAQTGKRDTFYDLSITKNVFNMMIAFIILTIIFYSIKGAYAKRKGQAPKGLQSFFEPIIVFLVNEVAKPNIGPKYEKFLPYLLSVFFFILINNLLGLVPFLGGINSSGNISFTLVLAMCSLLVINLNGNKDYWTHVFAMPGVPKWVLVILTPIEILGVFLKPAVLMLRLFGNITGGHIAVLSIVSLIFIMGEMGEKMGGAAAGGFIAFPILLFVNAMELFVAFLQAYVFTLLTAIFIGAAVEEHHHAEHH
jgi:F-type H+-transporting ATPase subunit a